MPSSTIANWFCGLVLVEIALVTCSKAAAPVLLNSSDTTQLTWLCGMPAEAWVRSLPEITVGDSRYFMVPVWSQVISG